MPRKIFIIGGFIAVLLSAFILYVNFFGAPEPRLLKKFFTVRSPYEAEASAMLTALADTQAVALSGTLSGTTGHLGLGLASFDSRVSSTVILLDSLALQLQAQTELKTLGRRTYYADVALRRPPPTHEADLFYFFVSRATAPPEVMEQVAPLLRRWVGVASDLVFEIAPEEAQDIGIDESELVAAIRATLTKTPLVTFNRKLGDTEFEYSITAKNLAYFLGVLFGDISGQPFSDEELLSLQDSFADHAVFGRIVLNPQSNLPKHLTFKRGHITGELDLAYPTAPSQIAAPKNALDIHELLGG